MYSNELICSILIYINQNINNKITLTDLANHFFFNKDYIMRLFKKELKITLIDYINSIRIYHTIQELNHTNHSMMQIALNNGFYSLEYFSETFHKYIGVNPTKYKSFYENRIHTDYHTQEIISNKLASIKLVIDKVNQYQLNKKPISPKVKKLSIFNTY